MDHVVYLDAKAAELGRLASGEKRMIARGAAGRKLPYGRVSAGDVLYFVENTGEGIVRMRATVSEVIQSEKLAPAEARDLLARYQDRLALTPEQAERWGGKRYLVLVGVQKVERLEPFRIDRSRFGSMDDWLLVEEIEHAQA